MQRRSSARDPIRIRQSVDHHNGGSDADGSRIECAEASSVLGGDLTVDVTLVNPSKNVGVDIFDMNDGAQCCVCGVAVRECLLPRGVNGALSRVDSVLSQCGGPELHRDDLVRSSGYGTDEHILDLLEVAKQDLKANAREIADEALLASRVAEFLLEGYPRARDLGDRSAPKKAGHRLGLGPDQRECFGRSFVKTMGAKIEKCDIGKDTQER